MENVSEYYYIDRADDEACLMIDIVGYEEDDDGNTLSMELEFSKPAPHNTVMADFLWGSKVILSKRIIDQIMTFDIDGVELVPTVLTGRNGYKSHDYMAVLASGNIHEAMDNERSKFEFRHGGYWISKLVLDRVALIKIPLKERLIFRLKELPGKTLFHRSVADAILALEPTGMMLVNIEDYQ